MEANAPAVIVILRVERNGAVCRLRRTVPHLPNLLVSSGGRDTRSRRDRHQRWPSWWIQALIVVVLGPLLGIGIPMLMGLLGY